jgi:hypothetical protein
VQHGDGEAPLAASASSRVQRRLLLGGQRTASGCDRPARRARAGWPADRDPPSSRRDRHQPFAASVATTAADTPSPPGAGTGARRPRAIRAAAIAAAAAASRSPPPRGRLA